MKKNVFGRQFKRDKNERKALFKGLMSSLILEERIKTTEEKAKAIKGHVEKLVTKAKNGGVHVQRLLERDLIPAAIDKLIKDVAPRFKERPGGYTRILKMGNRLSDNAKMALIEWVEPREIESGELKVESLEEKGRKESKAKVEKKVNKKSEKEEKKVKTEKKEKKETKK